MYIHIGVTVYIHTGVTMCIHIGVTMYIHIGVAQADVRGRVVPTHTAPTALAEAARTNSGPGGGGGGGGGEEGEGGQKQIGFVQREGHELEVVGTRDQGSWSTYNLTHHEQRHERDQGSWSTYNLRDQLQRVQAHLSRQDGDGGSNP